MINKQNPQEWFYLVNKIWNGPLKTSELKKLVENNVLKPDILLRLGLNGEPFAARQVKGLFSDMEEGNKKPLWESDNKSASKNKRVSKNLILASMFSALIGLICFFGIWKLVEKENYELLITLKGSNANGHFNTIQFSPDGKKIASGSDDSFKLWNAYNGKELFSFAGATTKIGFSPDGKKIAIYSQEKGETKGSLKVCDTETGKELFRIPKFTVLAQEKMPFFTPDGLKLINPFDFRFGIWDGITGEKIKREEYTGILKKILITHNKVSVCHAFSPDGTKLAFYGRDGSIEVFDMVFGDKISEKKGTNEDAMRSGYPSSFMFSHDGNKLLFNDYLDFVVILNAYTGNELSKIKHNLRSMPDAEFSPNSKTILVNNYIFDVTTEKIIFKIPDCRHATFSPDGNKIAGCLDGEIKIWKISNNSQ